VTKVDSCKYQVSSSAEAAPTDGSRIRLLADLGAASRLLDELWRAALQQQKGEALELGEASQALHRAVIALSQHSSVNGQKTTTAQTQVSR
jgi:hypothetical protein